MSAEQTQEWVVHQIRVSAFSSESLPSSESEWTRLTGETEAQNRTSVPGGRQFSSDGFGGVLALTVAGPRLDILAALSASRFEGALQDNAYVSLGTWREMSVSFVDQAVRYLEKFEQPITRLAFGVVVHLQCASQVANYRKLKELLKSVSVDPEKMRELVYRVNWPQESEVIQGLTLNRLTTWSSLMASYGMFNPSAPGQTAESHIPTARHHVVSLEIDHNSAADRREALPKDRVVKLLKELVSLANENIERGERP